MAVAVSGMATGAEVFGEEPADLGTFITSPRYLGLFRLSPGPVRDRAPRELGHPCGGPGHPRSCDRRIARYWAQEFSEADEISLEVGKAGGKDEVSRCIVLRAACLLLCLADPAGYFGLMPNSSIHLLNVAVFAAQAERVFFAPLVCYVRREGGWFAAVMARDPDARPGRTGIRFGRGIEAVSGNFEAGSMEVLNPLVVILDEISEFEDSSLKAWRRPRPCPGSGSGPGWSRCPGRGRQ